MNDLPPPVPDAPPPAVVAAAVVALLIGLVGAYVTFTELAWRPHAAFPVPKHVAVLVACAAVALVGLGLMVGLLCGRLGAWLGALNWALLAGALAAIRIGDRLWSGNAPGVALGRAPRYPVLVALAAVLAALLWLPGTRRWFAAMCRHRAGCPGSPPATAGQTPARRV